MAGHYCAGQNTAARYFVERGFMHIYIRDSLLRVEANTQSVDLTRPPLPEIAEAISKEEMCGSIGSVVLRGIELWTRQRERFVGGLVFSHLNLLEQAEEILAQKGTVLFIDAPPELRYKRARARSSEKAIVLKGPRRIRDIQTLPDVETIRNCGDIYDDFYPRLSRALGLYQYPSPILKHDGLELNHPLISPTTVPKLDITAPSPVPSLDNELTDDY